MTVHEIEERVRGLGDETAARAARGFFKSGASGRIGDDVFVGVKVPTLRQLLREYQDISLKETGKLLQSPLHEARLLAVLFLVRDYGRGDETGRQRIYDLYLKSSRYVNNWDLVDASAAPIVGAHLQDRPRDPLCRLAASADLWERRIAIIATHHFIKQRDFADAFKVAELLLSDKEDLIHKATGWTLREVGKRDAAAEEAFLADHYRRMPRTMLRYAIERFTEERRRRYLKGEI
jgi:3-methyladenine DNA glycosylase AlkD